MIAAVSTIRGDADVAPLSVARLFDQGVDAVYVATHDETAERALVDSGAFLFPHHERFWQQQRWMQEMAAKAGANGAKWIIPFDADEFWSGEDGLSVAESLATVPDDIPVVAATIWQHATWDLRQPEPERIMFKVVYRFSPEIRLGLGGHDLDHPKGLPCMDGILTLRHLPYRDYGHFREKTRDCCQRLPPEVRVAGFGRHHTCLEDADEALLLKTWEGWLALGTVHDPILLPTTTRP